MYRLVTLLFYISLFLNVSCQQQDNYKSRAEEIFPPVEMKYVALYRQDGLPIIPVFFAEQWSIVIFGDTPCDDDCLDRLALINSIESAKKLFVFNGQAKHKKLKELVDSFPNVAITMGTSAASFDNFYTQFDVDTVEPTQKHQQIYLVNPSSELVYSLPHKGLTSADLTKEITWLDKHGDANG